VTDQPTLPAFPPELSEILRLAISHAEQSIEPTSPPDEVEDGKAVAAAVRMLGYSLSDGAGTALWGMWCLDQRAGWMDAGRNPAGIISSIARLCESIRDGFGPYIVVGDGATRAIGSNPNDV
jgi:hypothetical protein